MLNQTTYRLYLRDAIDQTGGDIQDKIDDIAEVALASEQKLF